MKALRNLTALVVLLVGAAMAWAATPAPAAATSAPARIGSKGYVWNKMTREQVEILKLSGDFARGKEAFRSCRGCHRADGSGRPDGTYPRLTGQHAIVIVKQVTDTRAGLRVNEKMKPFATEHAVSLQEVSDIAVYLSLVQSSAANGKGPGTGVARGKQIYLAKRCDRCHGKNGGGDEREVYPVVAGQHYAYLLRELQYIKHGQRGNAHPDMAKLVSKLATDEMEALSDYLSSLPDYRVASGK